MDVWVLKTWSSANTLVFCVILSIGSTREQFCGRRKENEGVGRPSLDGEEAWWLRAPNTFAENLNFVSGSHTGQLTATSDFCFRGSVASKLPLLLCIYPHTDANEMNLKLKKNKRRRLCLFLWVTVCITVLAAGHSENAEAKCKQWPFVFQCPPLLGDLASLPLPRDQALSLKTISKGEREKKSAQLPFPWVFTWYIYLKTLRL